MSKSQYVIDLLQTPFECTRCKGSGYTTGGRECGACGKTGYVSLHQKLEQMDADLQELKESTDRILAILENLKISY